MKKNYFFPQILMYPQKNSFLPPANEDLGKVIFLYLFVILFRVHAGIPTPPPRPASPPWTRYPPDQAHPPDQAPPPHQAPRPGTEHAGRYGQHAGGTHSTGMQSCFPKKSTVYFY